MAASLRPTVLNRQPHTPFYFCYSCAQNRVAAINKNKSAGLVQAAGHLRQRALACRQRRLLVLAGDHRWCLQQAESLVETLKVAQSFWFGDQPSANIPSGKSADASGLLGSELDLLVFDVWSGFDCDAFGALSGCLRGGGLLVLLVPPSEDWREFDDPQNQRIQVALYPEEQMTGRYLQRFSGILHSAPFISWWKQNGEHQICDESGASNITPVEFNRPYKSPDQQQAVEAIINVVQGHRRRPVVLTSDRGRGKSAAFGIAAAQLIRRGARRILLTAPRRRSVSAAVDLARSLLSEELQGALEFVAPDELLRNPRDADLLLVDEAAGIPAPLLETLLRRYSRIAFASTVHGYEGTGRGFAIRFHRVLDRHTNSWKVITLKAPLRWSADDPLEALVFRLLLLDADLAPDEAFLAQGACHFEQLDRDQLMEDTRTLDELFGLLVAAHYQTRPFDVRHLLDGPNLSVTIGRVNGHVAAAALVAAEGGFDDDLSQAIRTGRRRPHGHLLPEVLAAQLGLVDAPKQTCNRIMRIAVHPAVQRQGIGTELLAHLTQQAVVAGRDYIGSSFGLSDDLFGFWTHSHWLPVWLSSRRGASSGNHSAVFLMPLNERGQKLLGQARERFATQFVYQLADHLKSLEPSLVVAVLKGSAPAHCKLNAADWLDIHAFAFEQRMPEVCRGSLWKLVCQAASDARATDNLTGAMRDVLVLRVLQARSWQETADHLEVPGRAQILELMRSAAATLYDYYNER